MKLTILGLFIAVSCCIYSCTKKENNLEPTTANKSAEEPTFGSNKVLLLMVDYTNNNFLGGKELSFVKTSSTFTLSNQYLAPIDFGSIKIVYDEINETLFQGSIVWNGQGKMNFPANFDLPNQFTQVATNDIVLPATGFQDIFNPCNMVHDYSSVWQTVQGLTKVRQYLASNPNTPVKIFLFTPKVGGLVVTPNQYVNAQWIIILKK
jgi:hypothetical protein